MTYVKLSITVQHGTCEFAFLYRHQYIDCIAVELKTKRGVINNIPLFLLETGQYALPEFEHPQWTFFNAMVDHAQTQFNYVDIKERLMVAHQEHFDLVIGDEEIWIKKQQGLIAATREDALKAVQEGNIDTFISVMEDFRRRFRR